MLDLCQTRNVVKANDLVMARYKLSTLEQKIVVLLISEIDFKEEYFSSYAIPIKNLLNALEMGSDGKDYHDLKAAIKKLMGKVLDISQPDGSWLLSHWVSSSEYDSKTKTVYFTFDAKLSPFLLGLKKAFTSYERKQVLRLSRSYSIRLYEIMAKNRRLGSFRIALSELRLILGIDQKNYTRYQNFKVKVLEPARKELEEKTNIQFNYREICQGRRIVSIEFTIAKNEPNEVKADDEKAKVLEDPPVVVKLKMAGLKDNDAWKIWKEKFDYVDMAFRDAIKEVDFEKYIDEKIFIVGMKKKEGKVDTASGLLVTAIRNNYGSASFTEQVEKKGLAVMRENLAELEDVKNQLIQRRDKMLQEALKKFLEKNPDVIGEVAGKLLLVAESGISALYNSGKTAAENYKNRLIKGIIDGEIRKSYPKVFAAILKKRDPEIAEIEARIEDLKLQMSAKK